MADYQEQAITGQMSQYTRCHSITIQNPRGGDPSAINARFEEEVIKTLPDGSTISSPGAGITARFDPEEVVAIRNPLTWELTGQTITVAELYALLASAYWHYATKRDAENG